MRLTWRDSATALAVAVATAESCTTAGGRMTEMYGAGDRSHTPVWSTAVTSTLGASALIGGLTAIIAASRTTLGVLVLAMVALWVLATACQQVAEPTRHVHRLRARH